MIWLPTEILEEILCHVDYNTVKQCCLVSRTWYRIIMSLNGLWLEMCHKNNIKLGGFESFRPRVTSSQHHVTSPQNHVMSPEHVLNSAEFYREKIRLMTRRCKEFNMKGYSFEEEIEPLDVFFLACSSDHVVMVLRGNELVCIDNVSWNVVARSYLQYSDEVVCLECNATSILTGHVSGRVTVYVMTSRGGVVTSRDGVVTPAPETLLQISCEFRARLTGVKCVKIDDSSRTIAMICNSNLTVYRDGILLHDIPDICSFNWSKLLWDGKTSKDGIYQNLLQFVSADQIVVASPRKLYLFLIGNPDPVTVKVVDIQDDHTDCPIQETSQKCYFWPSVVISDRYICCRTCCSVRLYYKQTFKLYKVFPKLYSSNERLIFPSDRVNIVGIGSKFLVTVDTHVFPRILIFDVESGSLISTIGNDRNECESQIPIYHGIYHMSYFVALPSRSWLDGDFQDDPRPCVVTYKHKDYLSDNSVWLFQLETFRVRADKPQEFFGQCSKITALEVRRKLESTENIVQVKV